jgi:hypothetical protein
MKFNRWLSGRGNDATEIRAAPGPSQPRQMPDRAVIAQLAAQIDRIERRSPRTNDARWVQPGEAVGIRGAIISGGAFYIGTALSAPALPGDEPALVNPDLAVELAKPSLRDADMAYWPSYGSLSPGQRATYLSWLASDRNMVDLPIGYVFLYFYGFERRVFVDLIGTSELSLELPWIRAEVERLQRVYGSNPSLNGYAQRFMWATDCLGQPTDLLEPPATPARSWRVPDSIKLGLGRLVAAGRPIPANWALAWLKSDPEAFLRTPAERCPDEFARLFVLRYATRSGEGLVINSDALLRLEYRPASRSFDSVGLPVGEVPDVTGPQGPIGALRELAQECTDALDPFSRWIRRNPDRTSLTAAALLPTDLVRATPDTPLDRMTAWLATQLGDEADAVVDGHRMLMFIPTTTAGKLAKPESAALCDLLAAYGYGIEPDVRFGGPALGPEKAVVFKEEPGLTSTPARRRDRVWAILDLAMTVAAVRNPDDETLITLTGQLSQALEIPIGDRRRVRAHLHWAAIQAPNLTVAKKTMSTAKHGAREQVGTFLVEWTAQRGAMGPDQVNGLTKAFTALGLEPASLFSLIHQRAVHPSAEPIEVRGLSGASRGEAIPPPPPQRTGGRVVLDGDALAAARASTAESTAMLGKIFVDDEPPLAAPSPIEPGNLSSAYRNLLSQLAARSTWSPSEFARLTSSLNLLPNRAIEVLNEAALDQSGEPVLEGDDVLEVNHDALKELLE